MLRGRYRLLLESWDVVQMLIPTMTYRRGVFHSVPTHFRRDLADKIVNETNIIGHFSKAKESSL